MSRKTATLLGTMSIVMLLLIPVAATAQPVQQEPTLQVNVDEAAAIESDLLGGFYYQGILTESGSPVNGTRQMEFQLWDSLSGGSQVGSTRTQDVAVSNGQFNVFLSWGRDKIEGTALWLRVRAKDGGGAWRDLGRKAIKAVPYAQSLVPGAWVRANSRVIPYALFLEHKSTESGVGLRVKANSDSPAIDAVGSGRIRSSAKSSVWISGNGVRPYHQNDGTIINMDTTGGAKILRGTGGAREYVMLPITVPGPLYGQDVTVSDLDLYWRASSTDLMGIGAVLMRRQTGVGSYVTILHDTSDRTCLSNKCTEHWDLTNNNVLTASSGILYLTIELSFLDAASWIQIGGARLTLEHN